MKRALKKELYLILTCLVLVGSTISFLYAFHCPVIQESRDSVRKQGLFLVQLYKVFGAKGIKEFHQLSGDRR